MNKRTGGVQAANYVVHIRGAFGKTFCGRHSVNCYPDGADLDKAVKEEQCCKLCARGNKRPGRGFVENSDPGRSGK